MTPIPNVLRLAAFTDDPAGGNPAGVVLDGVARSPAEMLAMAAEVGYSETAFVGPLDGTGRRPVRYFSPQVEVPFCGHATIAAAVAIAQRHGAGELVFATAVGDVPVEVHEDGDHHSATLTSVAARSRPATGDELADALRSLRWTTDVLAEDLPVHVANGGANHLVVPLATREQLGALDYDFDALRAACERHGWTTVHLVWREGPALYHARDPFPIGGVVEDPATGAAAAAFGGYLRTLGLVPDGRRVEVLQGVDMGRPSRLLLDLPAGDDRSRVTGRAVPIE